MINNYITKKEIKWLIKLFKGELKNEMERKN